MAYNTKNITRDAAGAPVPQYYNPAADQYEVIQGNHGANRVLLYDANGNPLLTAANPGVVKVFDGTDVLAVNADGSANVQLTSRKFTLTEGNYDTVLNVNSGGYTTITITPPAGELWRIKTFAVRILPPSDATSGNHEAKVFLGMCGSDYNKLFNAASSYDKDIYIGPTYIKAATILKEPVNEESQVLVMLSITCTNSMPLQIFYANNTNVSQTGTAVIRMVREVEYIVS